MTEAPPDFSNVRESGDSRARYWVFTLNNYTEEEVAHLRNLQENNENVGFISWGEEVAPATGTPHLQGQLELRCQLRWRQVRALVGPRVWIAVRRGTFEQAQQYVEKDGRHECFGERVSLGRGARNDMQALQEDLRSGKSLRYVAEEHFSAFIRYQRGITAFRLFYAVPRTWRSEVIVYWGTTGTGKTTAIYENLQSLDHLWKRDSNKWFDGYDDHPIALFDEFKPGQYDITYLLQLLDCYPMRVEVKGGFVNWAPREIYLTSNMDPDEWYFNALPEHRAALKRRIGHIVRFQ